MRTKLTKKEIETENKKKKQDEPKLLYYLDEIVEYLKKHSRDVGIIYVLSRNEAGCVVDDD